MSTAPQGFSDGLGSSSIKFLKGVDFETPQEFEALVSVRKEFNSHPKINAEQFVYTFRDKEGNEKEFSQVTTSKGLRIAFTQAGVVNEDGEIQEVPFRLSRTGQMRDTRWHCELL